MLRASLFLLAFIVPATAQAQTCSYSVTAPNFGPVDTLSGGNDDTTGTATITCSGTSGLTIKLCPGLGWGTGGVSESDRRMLSGGNVLNYQLYSDTWGGTIWGSNLAPNPPGPPELTMTLPSAPLSRTIYARVFGGQSTAPPGTYLSTYNPSSHRRLYYQYCVGGPSTCGPCGTLARSSNAASFTVQANVAANCNVVAQNINFGEHGVLDANVDATGEVGVTCTPTTSYTVGLNNGLTGDSPTTRRMTLGSEAVIYGLYKDPAHSQPWGNSGGDLVTGTGAGATQNLPVYGRVQPQTTPSPGTYTDTVVVTVTY